ncbi:hypothetical protein WA171_004904 [Blastocystis sp. BT1]
MSTATSRVRSRIVGPKPGRRSRVEADLSNQLKIDTYFTAYSTPTTSVKYKVLREETAGITVGHLRQLARLGGIVPLGALAFNTMLCDICGKGENEDSIIICDKCNKGFHLYCLKPILPSVPSGEWFCDACRENQKRKYYRNLARYQENQSLIVDFFKLERPIPVPVRYNFRRSTMPKMAVMTAPSAPKGKSLLKCYVPSTDPNKIKLQHVALASAMSQQGIAYSNELVYREGCPKSMNSMKFDEQRHLLKEMSKGDRAVYDATLKMNREGFMAPVIVREDDIQGFIVIADEIIRKDTYITEYIGEVDILAKNEQNSNDSIMDLLRSGNPKTSLVIIPEKVGNLARYLSGVNNSSEQSKKKQNVRSARYVIDNSLHVLLIALRDIKPGEILTFDYNGLDHNYPTDHFI